VRADVDEVAAVQVLAYEVELAAVDHPEEEVALQRLPQIEPEPNAAGKRRHRLAGVAHGQHAPEASLAAEVEAAKEREEQPLEHCAKIPRVPVVDRFLFHALRAARERIDRDYAQPLTLDELAREAALSRFHFVRTFRNVFGVAPGRYLTRVRVERAKALLVDGGSVTDVCFAVGFRSVGSFSARFRREVGRPPSTYRQYALPYCFVSNFGEARAGGEVVDKAA
jgi:AraC-like DNA-binding protein